MSGNSIIFEDKKNKTKRLLQNKEIFDISDIDLNKILVSKKEKYGKYNSFKHFIGSNFVNFVIFLQWDNICRCSTRLIRCNSKFRPTNN